MECKYCDDFTGICTNGKCPMCADCCPVPDVEGVCQYEERQEETYELTPKGCAVVALMDAKLIKNGSDPAVDIFFSSFVGLMEKFGYIYKEEEDNVHS